MKRRFANRTFEFFTNLNMKLFDRYDIAFPVDEKLAIITGMNGTGKTTLLELLHKYYEQQGEKVLYLPSERTFSFNREEWDSIITMASLIEEVNVLDKYNFKIHPWDLEGQKGLRIHSGTLQMINMFGLIYNLKEPTIVMIDHPEISLHGLIRRGLLKDILSNSKVKKLIVTTHSAEIHSQHENDTYDIKAFLKES